MDIVMALWDFVVEYKWWLAPLAPFVIGYIIVKIMG